MTAALILLGGTQLPAAAAAPDAPTDVQISWADVAKRTVRVTWKDNGEKNRLSYQFDGTDPVTMLLEEAAGGDNSILVTIGSGLIGKPKLRLAVWTEDAAHAISTSTPTAWFDTQLAAVPVPTNAEVLPGNSLRLTHRLSNLDVTPGDPLDLPAGTTLSVGRWTTTAQQPTETFPVTAGATTTIPSRPRPYNAEFMSHNEWGSNTYGYPLMFAPMGAALRVDPVTTFGQWTGFRIESGPLLCIPAGGCTYTYDPGVVSQIQSRANAGQPWKTIGTYSKAGTRIYGSVIANGSTQYRVHVPAWKSLDWTTATGITAATSTSARNAATQSAVDFGLTKSYAQVGQVVKAVVSVKPAGGGKASLQWLDGKVWRTSAYIPLVKGKGTLSFKASGRGTSRSWRVVIPQLTWYGKTIIPTTSLPWLLTVH